MLAIELRKATRQTRAAVPVAGQLAGSGERIVGIALTQAARDRSQARAEGEGAHAAVLARERMHPVKEHARVTLHRTGDVAQHHQRCLAPDAAFVMQRGGERIARTMARHRRQIQCAARRRRRAARDHRRHRQRQGLGNLLRQRNFLRRHGLKVGALHALAV